MNPDLLLAGQDRLLVIERAEVLSALAEARLAGFELIVDIFGIDWLDYPRHQGKRFSVTYSLTKIDGSARRHLRVHLNDGETLPTATHMWQGANFMEREVYDMFGVTFEGHPDLRKLLTPEDLIGHPHRKDFPLGETPTLFNDGRFLDPPSFRAGLAGLNPGLTGWKGGARHGVTSSDRFKLPRDESEQ